MANVATSTIEAPPKAPSANERRAAFNAVVVAATLVVKRIAAAASAGDIDRARKAYAALLEACRILGEAAR